MKNLEIQCKDDCSRIVKDLDYTGIDVQILDDIHKRSKEYYTSRRLGHSSFQLRLDHLVQVINGNAVYISFTDMFDALNNINYKYKNYFHISDKKYCSYLSNFVIINNNAMANFTRNM